MNVKTFYHGQQTRDELRKPITNEKRHYMKLNKWLLKWKKNPDIKGLSRPTFNAALQTSGAFPPLIDYLLDECNIEYVVHGHNQSDFLESRENYPNGEDGLFFD